MAILDLDPVDLQRALGRPVASWDIEAIDPHLRIHSVTGGVHRVRAGGASLVVKVVRRGVDDDPALLFGSGADPSHRNYWKREWLAFDSGLLDALPGPLRAPRRLLTTRRSDEECWIWMEDVRGRHDRGLRLDDYAMIARALGETQGRYAAGAALPSHDWLSHRWLRGWVGACARLLPPLADDARWRDERLAPLAPLRPRLLALWQSREPLLAIVESAPPTLVHCDFWPANLFVTDAGDAVAIDWSQVGIGALAQDLDQITLDPVWMQVRPDESLDRLEQTILPAYLDGLRAAGCDVAPAELRRWYAAAAALRYAWLAGDQPRVVEDPALVRASEERFGAAYATVIARRAPVVERAAALGEEALRG